MTSAGPGGGAPRASVVLVLKDEIATLARVLAMLHAQETDWPFEIIAIDSGSTDGSLELLRQDRAVRLVEIAPHEFHHSRTRNLGASLARGELVVLLTADAVPQSRTWLARLTAPFADPQVMGSYGRQVARAEHGPLQEFRLSYLYPATPARRTLAEAGENGLAYAFSDVNSCVRKAFWERHPYPANVAIAEDTAMARAIIDGGYALTYVPEAVVEHSHTFSAIGWFRRYYSLGCAYRDIGLTGRVNGNGRRVIAGPRLRSDGARYALAEMRWCLRRHGPGWAARSAIGSAAKALGFVLGRQYPELPRFLRRALEYRPQTDPGRVRRAAPRT